jgi:hypothetical protein
MSDGRTQIDAWHEKRQLRLYVVDADSDFVDLLGIPFLIGGVLILWNYRSLAARSRRWNTRFANTVATEGSLWHRSIDPGARFAKLIALGVGLIWTLMGLLLIVRLVLDGP